MISAATAAVSRAGRTRGRTYRSLGLRGAGAQTPEMLVVLTGARRLDLKCPEESAAGAKSHCRSSYRRNRKSQERSPSRLPASCFPFSCECCRRPGIRAARGPAENRDQTGWGWSSR